VEVGEITAAEVKAMYPHVEVGDVTCAVHLPGDGQCDPANIAMALAKGARMRGAQIVEGVKVTPSPMTASASRASTGRRAARLATSPPTSSSTAAACGAAIWPRDRA
jgi:glycine/D-amino acid oxidase-like deaminating enzyme